MGPKTKPLPQRTTRRVSDLVAAGLVDPAEVDEISKVYEAFALAVTPEMMELMTPGDPADPIFRQFVPTVDELKVRPEELADPIGDEPYTPIKGITHRYPDRVLLKPVHVCPVYCRFCFRREKVGPQGEVLSPDELQRALGYVRSHPEIWEVILTGGDPMVLSPRRLGEIVRELDTIGHVQVIRIHTRVPVVDPKRVTPQMVAALKVATPVYVAVHCNHARELTAQAGAACARLVDAGIPLLAQTVLLRGVNDDPRSLEELFRALIRHRAKPYYLHHGDLARGTGHLRTTLAEGQRLMRALRGRVSGICQPAYVLDIPGGHGKVPAGPGYLRGDGRSGHLVEDLQGKLHAYPPPEPLRDANTRSHEMTETPGWQETDSEEFLDQGKFFVPDRELQIETVCDLIPTPPAGALLVELCCGEGLISRALLEKFPNCRVQAFDGSARMIEHAKGCLAEFGDRFHVQLFDLADRSWRRFNRPPHAVVSSLAVHHLDGEKKRLLFRDVEQALAPGGCLILADLISPTSSQGRALAGKHWDQAVRERSLALTGDLRAFERFQDTRWNLFSDPEPDPIDKPSTLLDQLRWLEEAGFSGVDAFWVKAGHAIFGGYKVGA